MSAAGPGPAPPVIGAALPSDLPRLAALDQAAFEQAWPQRLLAAELLHDDGLALVARSTTQEPIAYVLFRRLPGEVELLRLATDPPHRRRGLARALVLAGLDRLRAAGACRCHLEVRVTNLPAIQLYEALGFSRTGTRRAYYPEGTDAALYARDL
jgi:ribosomal-protein-alanine N-acetyltransferase